MNTISETVIAEAICGEPEPLYLAGEHNDEPDIYQCPKCLWEKRAGR